MYKVIIHGSYDCDACVKSDERLTLKGVPFEFDELKDSNTDYSLIPVIDVVDSNTGKIVKSFVGELEMCDVSKIQEILSNYDYYGQ